VRDVSPERARRIQRGVVTDRCRSCKNRPEHDLSAAVAVTSANESDLRWWVERFGGSIPRTVPPSRWVAEHGLPWELDGLVASLVDR
jgi:hypothetical protein